MALMFDHERRLTPTWKLTPEGDPALHYLCSLCRAASQRVLTEVRARCVRCTADVAQQAIAELRLRKADRRLGCRRPHQSLASVGVAALVRLIVAAGDRMGTSVWVEAITTLHNCAAETRPVCASPAFRAREPVLTCQMSTERHPMRTVRLLTSQPSCKGQHCSMQFCKPQQVWKET